MSNEQTEQAEVTDDPRLGSSRCSPFYDVAKLIHSEWDRIETEAFGQGTLYQEPDAEVDHAINEIARLLEGALKVRVRLGSEIFRFTSYSQWVNKASSWFRGARLRDGYGYICVDAEGRICQRGTEFMRARDDDSFPIVVYALD